MLRWQKVTDVCIGLSLTELVFSLRKILKVNSRDRMFHRSSCLKVMDRALRNMLEIISLNYLRTSLVIEFTERKSLAIKEVIPISSGVFIHFCSGVYLNTHCLGISTAKCCRYWTYPYSVEYFFFTTLNSS